MNRIIYTLIFLLVYENGFSQDLSGEYILKGGEKYNVSEKLILKPDSTFEYSWAGGLSQKYSFGNWSRNKDTIYLSSYSKDRIKSAFYKSDNTECLTISVSQEPNQPNPITAHIYFKDSVNVMSQIMDKIVLGDICSYLNDKEREIAEYQLYKIEKKGKHNYNYTNIDSIVFQEFLNGELGSLKSDDIKGNIIEIEFYSSDYLIFNNEKCIIKNKKRIYFLDDKKKIRQLIKTFANKQLLSLGLMMQMQNFYYL